MRARRAMLYMPGHDWHKIRKAASMEVDSICMDLEDGVTSARKDEARQAVAEALRTVDFGASERLFRINAVGSGLDETDLEVVLPAGPDGVVIPKVSSALEVRGVSERIAAFEQAQGWDPGGIRLLAIVETALGIVHLPEIAAADPRLEVLIFGAEDLAVDLGAERTPEGWEVFHGRSAVVTYAAAYELQALDMIYVDYRDAEGLQDQARQGAKLGYTGMQVIHPNQVAPAQEAFTPGDEAIVRARRILEAHAEHTARGVGVFELDGKMVDMPMVRAAQRVLDRARAAGKYR